MSLLVPLAAILMGPEAAPAVDIVQRCDADAMQVLTRAEPRRRSEWAAAFYGEQQAIQRDRAEAQANVTVPIAAQDIAALAALDARQRQLEGARLIETNWRQLLDELRSDFLANCGSRKTR